MIKRYPLAAKMGKSVFECKPTLGSTMISKTCEKAYKLSACLQGVRDLCEGYIAAQTWPLRKGWSFCCFHEKTLWGKKYLFPDKESSRPKKYDTDADFVHDVELMAVEILGNLSRRKKICLTVFLGWIIII